MRDVLDVSQPAGVRPVPVDDLVGRGDDLPDVAEEKQPHDHQRDARQPVLPAPAHGTVAPAHLLHARACAVAAACFARARSPVALRQRWGQRVLVLLLLLVLLL